MTIWDVGTEADQAPGLGPNQPGRLPAPDTGSAKGVVRAFDSGTRAIPSARDLVAVQVDEDAGRFVVTLTNRSAVAGTPLTPISSVLWVVHDESVALFAPGSPAAESAASRPSQRTALPRSSSRRSRRRATSSRRGRTRSR